MTTTKTSAIPAGSSRTGRSSAGLRALAALLVVGLVAACAGPSKSTVDEAAAGASQGGGATSSGVGEGGMGQGGMMGDGGVAGGSALGGPGASQENRVIYFDFDRFDIKPEYNAILQAHGKYLSANRSARVRLEGHADERGSREYNIGLGEKRAQAVRNVLLLQGAVFRPDHDGELWRGAAGRHRQ